MSKNLHRRHLSVGQLAMIAARRATAKKGDRTDLGEISPKSLTSADAANLLNVNRSTVISAKTVLKHGTHEEIEAVEKDGESVSGCWEL